MINKRVLLSITMLILCMVIITVTKPSFIFDKNGDIKPFGTGNEKSIYSLGVVVAVISVFAFYVFSMMDLMFD